MAFLYLGFAVLFFFNTMEKFSKLVREKDWSATTVIWDSLNCFAFSLTGLFFLYSFFYFLGR